MNYENFNNKVVILNDKNKPNFLEKISKQKKLLNIKIITFSEFKKKYFFDYTRKTVHYIMNHYNCIYEIALIYLDYLYYIDVNIDYKNSKLRFLRKLKQDLYSNNLLIENILFKKYIHGKEVIIYDLDYIDDFFLNIFKSFKNVEFIKMESFSKSTLYKLDTLDNEVSFIAEQMVNLINSGIDINKIKLGGVSDNYIFKIYKIFKLYNININGLFKQKASSSILVKAFKDNFNKDINITIEYVKTLVKTEIDASLLNSLISIINNYNFIDNLEEVKDMLFKDIDNISLPNENKVNAVQIVDFISEEFNEDEYVFVLGFNQGLLPVYIKDEAYLNDKEKKLIGIDTSINTNVKSLNRIKEVIKRTNNLTITYAESNLGEELYLSNAYEEELFIKKEPTFKYNSSNSYNKLVLTSNLDLFYKYGVKTDILNKLLNHYNNFNYASYDNKFSGIDKNTLDKYYEKGLTLSYTSINDFYHCSFKYYIKNVLKSVKMENTFEQSLGTIFHYCLSKCFNKDFDLNKTFDKSINDLNYEMKKSDLFYLEGLKDYLKVIIDIIKDQTNSTAVHKYLLEQRVVVPLNDKESIIFKGFIDKLLVFKYEEKDVYFIIDYKTGNTVNDLNNVYYGIDMQLPTYLYLVKRFDKNALIGGFYLQNIISEETEVEDITKDLRLKGFTTSNKNIISLLDESFDKSSLIYGMSTTKDGEFSKNARILSEEEITNLDKLTEEKIQEATKNILEGNYKINPKEIDNNLVGCTYCTFKDICFMKKEDVVKLKKVDYKEFLKGDNND